MTPDDIQSLLKADPFERFYLNLSDGSSYEVSDPAQVSITPSGGAVEYQARGRRTLIAIEHVVSITYPSAAGDPYFLRGK